MLFRIISPIPAKNIRENPFTNGRKSATISCGSVNLPRRRPITPTAHFVERRLPKNKAVHSRGKKMEEFP